jgi:hypothetical protein
MKNMSPLKVVEFLRQRVRDAKLTADQMFALRLEAEQLGYRITRASLRAAERYMAGHHSSPGEDTPRRS